MSYLAKIEKLRPPEKDTILDIDIIKISKD